MRADAGHRGGRQDHSPRLVLPDGGQLLLRRLLQGRRDPAGVGAPDRLGVQRGLRLPRGEALGHGPRRRRGGHRHLAHDRRCADGAHPAPWPEGQLLAHGRPRPRRTLLGDLLRPRARARPRGWARGRRGPLPRGLEPGLHAVRAVRGAHQGRLRHPWGPAEQEHRHRHGPGAHGCAAAGRGQHLRDRHHQAHPRQGDGAVRSQVRRRAQDRRGPAGRGRPRPHLRLPDRRRRPAGQRGARLRAAPDHAPGRAEDAPAGSPGPVDG